jgi:hypothetical protein
MKHTYKVGAKIIITVNIGSILGQTGTFIEVVPSAFETIVFYRVKLDNILFHHSDEINLLKNEFQLL